MTKIVGPACIIHERFCCNRRSLTQARRARLAGKARLGGTGLTRHASLALRACRAPLRHLATNRRELCGLAMLLCLILFEGLAQAVPYDRPKIQLPEPRGYVSDHAQVIDGDWKERIRSVCQDLERKTGVEMVVVTVPTISRSGRPTSTRRRSMKNGASDRRNKSMACWCWSRCRNGKPRSRLAGRCCR